MCVCVCVSDRWVEYRYSINSKLKVVYTEGHNELKADAFYCAGIITEIVVEMAK